MSASNKAKEKQLSSIGISKRAKKGYKIAAADARRHEEPGCGWRTSGSCNRCSQSNQVASVVDSAGCKVDSFPEHELRIAKICVTCVRGLQIFAVFCVVNAPSQNLSTCGLERNDKKEWTL